MTLPELPPLLLSWCVGLLSGFLISIPVGPINITIINDGARKGFLNAWLIGLGAMTMDVIYCGIGFAGFTPVFHSREVRAAMELGSFLLVFILGLKYLLAKPVVADDLAPSQIEKKFHPHSSFAIGFVRVLGNPAVLLFWITMAATFTSRHWVDERSFESKALCILGIGLGASVWFLWLSYAVTKLHRRFSSRTMVRLSQCSGASLLCLSVIIGYRIVELLAIKR
jgi:threonine/homoserine/homoserine lactone efflux protein